PRDHRLPRVLAADGRRCRGARRTSADNPHARGARRPDGSRSHLRNLRCAWECRDARRWPSPTVFLFHRLPRQVPRPHRMTLESSLRADIVEVGRRLYARAYTASNDGNISARLGADRLLMTPKG